MASAARELTATDRQQVAFWEGPRGLAARLAVAWVQEAARQRRVPTTEGDGTCRNQSVGASIFKCVQRGRSGPGPERQVWVGSGPLPRLAVDIGHTADCPQWCREFGVARRFLAILRTAGPFLRPAAH